MIFALESKETCALMSFFFFLTPTSSHQRWSFWFFKPCSTVGWNSLFWFFFLKSSFSPTSTLGITFLFPSLGYLPRRRLQHKHTQDSYLTSILMFCDTVHDPWSCGPFFTQSKSEPWVACSRRSAGITCQDMLVLLLLSPCQLCGQVSAQLLPSLSWAGHA